MPKYIVKLNDGKQDLYMEWSTIVDAPVSYLMPLEMFKEYYKDEYGNRGMEDLEERMERVEKKGTSSRLDVSVEDTIEYNRAGDKEKHISTEEIIEKYRWDNQNDADENKMDD